MLDIVWQGLGHTQIMNSTGHKKQLTLQYYIKSGTDINKMLEIGKTMGYEMARKCRFATLSVTGIKKPHDCQGVNCF